MLNELYVTVGKNRLYAVQGRASTNDLAERARGSSMRTPSSRATTTTARRRQVEPHDGPDPHRLHVLEAAAAQRHARRAGDPAVRRGGDGRRGRGLRGGLARLAPRRPRCRRSTPTTSKPRYSRSSTAASRPSTSRRAERAVARVEPPAAPWSASGACWVSVDWDARPAGRHRLDHDHGPERRPTVTVKVPLRNPATPRRTLRLRRDRRLRVDRGRALRAAVRLRRGVGDASPTSAGRCRP